MPEGLNIWSGAIAAFITCTLEILQSTTFVYQAFFLVVCMSFSLQIHNKYGFCSSATHSTLTGSSVCSCLEISVFQYFPASFVHIITTTTTTTTTSYKTITATVIVMMMMMTVMTTMMAENVLKIQMTNVICSARMKIFNI